MRPILLSRIDIRPVPDRSTGAITLRYVGRKLRFHERPYGYPEGTFLVVDVSEVPLPEKIVSLAASVGVDLTKHPVAEELRQAVAGVLVAEATMNAPAHLAPVAEPSAAWLESDLRGLEHNILAAENRVESISRSLEASLRQRLPRPTTQLPPVTRPYAPMPPASSLDRIGLETSPPEPAASTIIEEDDVFLDEGPVETSEATGRRVMSAVKTARDQELPQRLPGGARKALGRLPAGLYLSHGNQLLAQSGVCAAMVNGAESGKRHGESTVIDWDGEWPVVARRYGSHGRIVYRVEDALRRAGIYFENEAT